LAVDWAPARAEKEPEGKIVEGGPARCPWGEAALEAALKVAEGELLFGGLALEGELGIAGFCV